MTKIPEIRRFNEAGNQVYVEIITSRSPNLSSRIAELVFDDQYTIKSPLATEFKVPATRRELGEELIQFLGEGKVLRAFSRDPLLWNWISAALLPHILGTPADLGYLGETERWVLSQTSFRYYRHLCAGAYFAYEAHSGNPDRAMSILCQDIKRPGEIVGQIQGTEDLAYSVGAEVATKLYYDPVLKQIKPGAGGKGPGSARRLASAYLNQIRVTIDFKGMDADAILNMLPPEFDRFKAASSTVATGDGFDDDEDYDYEFLRGQLQ